MSRKRVPPSPFRCFNNSPEVIRLVVMMYVKGSVVQMHRPVIGEA